MGRVLSRLIMALRRAARRLVMSCRRAARRLDPLSWLVRTRRADLIVSGAYLLAVTAGLAAAGALDPTDIASGLPSVAFMLLVLIRAYKASVARRNEEKDEIADARALTEQCKDSLGVIARSLQESPEDYRTYLALSRLSSEVRLLVTRYRRYLSPDAVSAVLEAEKLILGAEVSRTGEIGARLRAIGHKLDIIGGGIGDVDDPGLRAVRDRI